MAINFLNNVDFNSIQSQNIVIENFTSDAAAGTGVEGQLYWNTTVPSLRGYDVSLAAWIPIGTSNDILTFAGGTGGNQTVDLNAQTFTVAGTTNQIVTSGAGQTLTIAFPTIVTLPASSIVATTPTAGDDSLKIATTAFVKTAVEASDTLAEILAIGNVTGGTDIAVSAGDDITFTATSAIVDPGSSKGTAGQYLASTGTTIDWLDLPIDPNEKYTLPVTALAGNQARVSLTGSTDGVVSTVDFIGTAGRIAITSQDQNNGSVTIDFPTNVEIAGTLDTAGKIAVAGTALSTFAGQVQIVGATAGNTNNAVTLGQLNTAVAGIGVFQGGYNVATNTPALTGGSNVALDQGDFFVVTTGGTFYTVTLEIGDFIFAAADIAASSSPAVSEYTIVRADANLAGLSADEPSAIRGVAGFDSAYFTADAGWISLNRQTNANGAKQALNDTAPSERTFLNGLTTFEINLADTSLFGANALAENVTVEVTQNVSPYQTVYADVTRSGSAAISIIFSGNVAVDVYRVLLTHI